MVVLTHLKTSTFSVRIYGSTIGYARGRNKRVIQTARKGINLEFDIRNWKTLFYRNATELEQKLIVELRAAYIEVAGDGT
jgi:hypothetical protein